MISIKKINRCDLYVLLWSIYYLQGLLYSVGAINQIVQLLMILLGLFSFVNCIKYSQSILIKSSMILVIMYVIYGLEIIFVGDGVVWTEDQTYLKNSFNSLLPIFFFYENSRKGYLVEYRLKIYTLIMTAVVILYFTYNAESRIEMRGQEEITNNVSYMFVGLLPMIFFFHKKITIQYCILAVLLAYIVMGMKRGAIIIGSVSVLIFFFSGLKSGSNVRKRVTLALSIMMVIILIYYVLYMMETSDYFMRRIEDTMEGNSSRRDIIYNSLWNVIWNENDLFCFLFGHGANSTVRYAGNFAHQDWLETWCNNGILGLFVLMNFFIVFFMEIQKCKCIFPPQYFYCFLAVFVIAFFKTMFSMSIQNLDIYQSMLIGYFSFWTTNEGQSYLQQNNYELP